MPAKCWQERLVVRGFFHDQSGFVSAYVCSLIQDRHLYLINHIDKGTIIATNLSKIITAGVIKVAEPAATKTSAARYSASLFRL